MRIREPAIPLVLWICAAICGHMAFGGGGAVVGKLHEDHSALAILGHQARDIARQGGQTLELDAVVLDKAEKDDPEPEEVKPPEPPAPEKPKVTPPEPTKEAQKEEERKKQEEEKRKVALVLEKDDPLKKLDTPQLLQNDKRIAVVQHAAKNQEDNPTASHIADEANHVEKEEMATLTSHDQNDPNPTPGGNHAGAQSTPGDSDRTKIAESDEHKGEKNRAPGERGTEFDVQRDPMPERPTGPVAVAAKETSPTPPRGGGDGRAVSAPHETRPPELAPGGQEAPSPEVVQGNARAAWSFNPLRPNAGTGALPNPAQGSSTKTPAPSQGATRWLGLGGQVGPGQMNINLTHQGVIATVGQDQLKKEREADGERRKSEHRGSWTASNFERWRSAIENYSPTVKPGNQTALNTAAVPFASYINHVHNRIHPIFADSFLSSLDSLPSAHPLNNVRMFTRLEIVVTKEGRLVKMGIVKASGVTAFDIAALDSVSRASPFGPAPSAIHSPDGNVYLHWEFHRDESACTTANARPFILNVPAPGPPVEPPPGDPKGPPTKERGAPPPVNLHEVREGRIETSGAPPRG